LAGTANATASYRKYPLHADLSEHLNISNAGLIIKIDAILNKFITSKSPNHITVTRTNSIESSWYCGPYNKKLEWSSSKPY
jgi:hypothetical protein